jgi:hypothetical protein
MVEISLRVPLVVSPGGPVVMRNLATCRKTYYATVYVGMPVRKRYLRMGFRRASEAREYARRVCDRYYQLWRAREYSGAEQLAKEISVEGG